MGAYLTTDPHLNEKKEILSFLFISFSYFLDAVGAR